MVSKQQPEVEADRRRRVAELFRLERDQGRRLSISGLAREMQVTRSTARKWLRQLERGAFSVEPGQGGRPQKIPRDDLLEHVRQRLEADARLKAPRLCEEIQALFKVTYKPAYMRRLMKRVRESRPTFEPKPVEKRCLDTGETLELALGSAPKPLDETEDALEGEPRDLDGGS